MIESGLVFLGVILLMAFIMDIICMNEHMNRPLEDNMATFVQEFKEKKAKE